MNKVLLVIAALTLGACTSPEPDLDELAREYLFLELSMGQHDEAHVDAYFGPEELRTAAEDTALTLDQILTASQDLAARLAAIDAQDTMLVMRIDALLARLRALDTRIAINKGEYLDFDDLMERFDKMMDWLAETYVKALNIIHYMHDKYCPENILMALHDKEVFRTMACGIAGLSIAADSLSAVKHAKVKVIRNKDGLAVDYEVQGDFPVYGNNDDAADAFAVDLVKRFMDKLRRQPTYRNAVPTQAVLTITSNVVYGKKTGSTPDGRKAGAPFAPGANPTHGRDKKGAVASMASVAKLPYAHSQDGISYTFSIVPKALGKTQPDQIANLGSLLDGYFAEKGHHINVNIFEKETLLDAMEHPEKYPQLTIRVSGYAVNFIKLTREQQLDVINRTFHERM